MHVPSPDQLHWPCALSDTLKRRLLALAQPGRGLASLGLGHGHFPGVIYFLRGQVHIYLACDEVRSFVGAVVGTGDWLGGLVVADQFKTDFLLADEVEPVEYLLLPTEPLQRLAAEEPEVYKWLYFIVAEIQPKWMQASITSFQNKQTRLIYSLLQLIAQHPPPRGVLPQVQIAQEQLAQLAGISRPRLNEVLKQLEAAGELELKRGLIRVLDLPALCRRLRSPLLGLCDPREQAPLKALLERSHSPS